MADNFNFTEGSGKTAAADDISSILHPRHKLIHGADGVNDGDVSTANPYPVRLGRCENQLGMVSLPEASITGSYADVVLGTITGYTTVFIWNDTDGVLSFSWDAGTTNHFVMPARAAREVQIKAGATALHVKYLTNPSTGTVYFEPRK